MNKYVMALAASTMLLNSNHAVADASEIELLRQEIANMKNMYESKIEALESKVAGLDTPQQATETYKQEARRIRGNEFNPSVGLILNGKLSSFSSESSEIAGFAVAHEGERGKEGFSLGETELNMTANIDDKFKGHATLAFVQEEGEDKVELEEAYIETLGGTLPHGLNVKAGRAFWTLGYLNEHHAHADDFADRPLPYRAFMNKSFNDDGLEVSYLLPTDIYAEVGAGIFRGDDHPNGGADSGTESWSAFARVGSDVDHNQSWRAGLSTLQGSSNGRATNEDAVNFTGDTQLYIADARYTYAPTGNSANQEIILQGEYFKRYEDGSYEDTEAATGNVALDDDSSGWYTQAVYKWAPKWRAGVRYSQLEAADTPAGLAGSALDAEGHNADSFSTMVDWTNSEFSRLRLQYNHEELASGIEDDQLILQYTMSLGAHGAHKF